MTAVHPRLAAAFAALDASGVRWCLLRGREDLAAPAGDVDLLFDPRGAAAARRTLAEAEMPALRVWGRGTQSFFLGWDRASERWVYVHAMTELSFGPFYGIRLGDADAVLARRVPADGVPMPAPDDRFWITLLHGLLDKGRLAGKHRAALAALAPAACADGDLAREVRRLAPGGDAAALLDAVRSGRWEELERLGPALRARAERLDPRARVRAAAHRASLLAVKLSEAVTRRGTSVALLAPDGAGKSTLAAALADSLFFPVRRFYLGLEGGPFAGSRPSRVPGLGTARRLVYVWRTYLAARWHQARRRFVVFDRHPVEALLAPPDGTDRLSRARRAVLGRALPDPDVVLVLDAPADVLHRRKAEHPPARLERDRSGYLALARRLPRAVVLDAARPFPEVRRDAVEAIWRAHRRRLGSR